VAAVPSIGRAGRVEGAPAPEADLTRALYEQYGNQIFRYCLHQLGSREEAEDAVQSTFLNAFRGIKRGVVPELESAWLFKIAHNVCLSRRRTSWRRERIESPTDFDVVEELAPAPSRRADELIGLQDVLEQMPEGQRRAILLREWQGLSYREIGEELELSQAAVETLIFRARRSLAAGLEQSPKAAKRRLVRGVDLGSLLAGIKSLLLGGGAAAKVAAAVAVVGAGTVVATAPIREHRAQTPPPSRPAVAPVSNGHAAPRPASPAPRPVAAVPAAGAAAAAQGHHRRAASTHARRDATATEPAATHAPPVSAPPEQSIPQPAADGPHRAASAPTAKGPDHAKTGRGSAPPAKGADSRSEGRSGKGGEPGAPSSSAGGPNGNDKGKGKGPKEQRAAEVTPPAAPADAPPVSGHAGKGAAGKAVGDPTDPTPVAIVSPPATVTLPVLENPVPETVLPLNPAKKDK
jgi:RNA polymerase sigma factor (sigma-70 family)